MDCSSSFVSLPGFEFYRGDVLGNVKKHGAGLYVSKTLEHVQIDVELPNLVVVHLISLDIFVISVYRPPSYSREENTLLMQFLTDFSYGKELIVLGDFNLPSIKWPFGDSVEVYITPVDREFYGCFVECGLSQWVEFGTFVPSDNILDLVLTSELDRIA